jgi:hypothetical protein
VYEEAPGFHSWPREEAEDEVQCLSSIESRVFSITSLPSVVELHLQLPCQPTLLLDAHPTRHHWEVHQRRREVGPGGCYSGCERLSCVYTEAPGFGPGSRSAILLEYSTL